MTVADVINLKKRLIGKEDINFDITGNDETENFFSAEGEQYKLTKLNASHIPLTANTREKTAAGNVDLALLNFANKIDNFVASDVLTENLTIIFEAEDSAETIQDKINLQKKNLNGYTLTFVFPAQLSQNLYSAFEWKDFYNGSIIITGGTASSKIAIYDQVNMGSLFRFYRCQCEVVVQYFYFVHQYSQYAISAESTSALIVQDCNFSGIPNVDSYAINKYASNIILTNCEFYEDMEYYPVEKQESAAGKYIGEVFAYPAAQPPEGAYLLNGQTITNCKTLYPEFYEWVNNSGVRKITATTYENAIAQYGFCGGFVVTENDVRLPNFNKTFLQGGTGSEIGIGVPAGLPNITGALPTGCITYEEYQTGALYVGTDPSASEGRVDGDSKGMIRIDASRSSPIYGKSDTVQPPAIRVSWCIQVFNVATELSQQESAQLASQIQMKMQTDLSNGVKATQNAVNNIMPNAMDYVIKSWSDNNGNWYRKYRSGWIEQGGIYIGGRGAKVVTLNTSMQRTDYALQVCANWYHSTDGSSYGITTNPDRTTTTFTFYQTSNISSDAWSWIVMGY
jgi:hypothetical protein